MCVCVCVCVYIYRVPCVALKRSRNGDRRVIRTRYVRRRFKESSFTAVRRNRWLTREEQTERSAGRLAAYTIGILSTHLIRYALVVVILRANVHAPDTVYLRCCRIIVLLYIKGVQTEGSADGFKGTSRCVFANGTQSFDAERTVVYMISTFLASYSWLNEVALALVLLPRGARYWFLRGAEEDGETEKQTGRERERETSKSRPEEDQRTMMENEVLLR